MAYQPPPEYQTPPVYQPPPTPQVKVVYAPFFSNMVVLATVVVGIIMIFLGLMIGTSLIFQHDPSTDTVRNTYGGSRIVLEIGGLLTCLGFFGGAINNDNLDVKIKVAFISAGISFIVTVLIVLNLFGLWGI